jgi:endonuclease/exonuclease/phosphatase family metal-dependent hydrolase
MRAVTYNVRGFRDGRGRVAAVVRELAPDVLLLQESGSRRDLRRFAEDVGMRGGRDPWSPLRRRVKNAVLLGDGWRFSSVELKRFPKSRRWYPRGALIARGAFGANMICAFSVHFGLEGAERADQAASLADMVAMVGDGLVIVGADLNATPDMRATARITADLRDAWSHGGEGPGSTFPALAPSARIDYLFVGNGAAVVRASVGAEGASEASDHLPVAVDLRLENGQTE